MGVMVHPTAIIGKNVELGENVIVGPYTIIHDNVYIGDNTTIEAFCEIGRPTTLARDNKLIIGESSLIRSHSVFYQGSVFGEGLVTGHRVVVRENTTAGRDFQIGSFGDILGDVRIGDFVKFNSGVFVPKNTVIGNYVWVFPHAVFTNDKYPPSDVWEGPIVEDYAVIGAGSVILPGVRIGRDSVVGAGSVVTADVEAGVVVVGVPAKFVKKAGEVRLEDRTPAYPWRRHFHRGYPEEIVGKWIEEFEDEG